MVMYISLVTLPEYLTVTSTLDTNMKALQITLVAAILLLLGIADLAVVSLFLVAK
jgi:hypothetical protein